MANCFKCGAELSQSPDEQTFLNQTISGLKEWSEEDRIAYVRNVVANVGKGFKLVQFESRPVKKLELFGRAMADLKGNGQDILESLLFSVKPEYRKDYVTLIQALIGVEEGLVIPEVP